MKRRNLISLATAAGLAVGTMGVTGLAQAQAWPAQKPIRLIVPFAAGGNADIIGRVFAQKIGESIGQSIVVDNRAGAGGSIGATLAAREPADGYTLFLGDIATHAINRLAMPKLPYDAEKDFVPVSRLTSVSLLLVANGKSDVNDTAGLIKWAKANPGKLSYGSSGNGTPSHLSTEMLRGMTGMDIQHIPYKGSAPALNDLVAGQIDLMIDGSAAPLVKAGKLKVLAVTGQRSPAFPNVPTLAEAGVAGFNFVSWHGLFAPKGTPPEVVRKVAAAVAEIARRPDVRAQLEGLGITLNTSSGQEFSNFIAQQRQSLATLVKQRQINFDQ
ncbi:Tripartite-type tricarboxylate transporter, receptor component TctC [Polaromonas sp. OV174]|uniref:Bug family tripartite tricarboxylate transporter substrate binding protein n=1 Tax=Polaromonas sp. OV174 TaxID=1855300 RepID=UPI0008E8237D|nr:tripartite tricarboxylate transporter substrate binding protein [Polaromonas sp. OV174]SFB83710.1 Tripartite-type tricarboxylate transporter, receptor component TctC [Polaromonas sp. OV174]